MRRLAPARPAQHLHDFREAGDTLGARLSRSNPCLARHHQGFPDTNPSFSRTKNGCTCLLQLARERSTLEDGGAEEQEEEQQSDTRWRYTSRWKVVLSTSRARIHILSKIRSLSPAVQILPTPKLLSKNSHRNASPAAQGKGFLPQTTKS